MTVDNHLLRLVGTVPGMDFRVGARIGPLMVSAPIGGGRRGMQEVTAPIPLDQAVAELAVAGWRVTGRDATTVLMAKGWTALRIERTAQGVAARRVTSRRTALAWTAVGVLLVAVIAALGS